MPLAEVAYPCPSCGLQITNDREHRPLCKAKDTPFADTTHWITVRKEMDQRGKPGVYKEEVHGQPINLIVICPDKIKGRDSMTFLKVAFHEWSHYLFPNYDEEKVQALERRFEQKMKGVLE